MKDEASYVCDSCGEEIVVPIDLSAGTSQKYVEDCPVCCCLNVVHGEVDDDADRRVPSSASSSSRHSTPTTCSSRRQRSEWRLPLCAGSVISSRGLQT